MTTTATHIEANHAAALLQQRIVTLYNRANTWADHPSYEDRGALLHEVRAIEAILNFVADATGADPATFSTSVVLGVRIEAWWTFTTALYDAKTNIDYRNHGRAKVALGTIFDTRYTRPLF